MPVVPPAATLTYEVELLDFSAEDDGRCPQSLAHVRVCCQSAVLLGPSARRNVESSARARGASGPKRH